MEKLPEISLNHLQVFLAVLREGSLRSVARNARLSPGQVSKIIKHIETELRVQLFLRSPTRMTPTPACAEFAKLAEQAIALMRDASQRNFRDRATNQSVSIGAVSFLSSQLLPYCLPGISKSLPNTTVRFVEFTHNSLVSHGIEGAFDMALQIGPLDWPRTWKSEYIGDLEWGLFARKRHPLGRSAKERDVAKFPFVVPIDWQRQGYTVGTDFCPLSVYKRKAGHEVFTAEAAVSVIASSDNLTFVPSLMARTGLQAGLIEPIRVQEWSAVRNAIYLTVKEEVVPQKTFLLFAKTLREQLSKQLSVTKD